MRPLVLPIVLLVAAACASPRGGPGGAASGRRAEETLDVDGTARRYRLHVPAAWDRARSLPLLLVFHGAGSDAQDIERGSGFDALADADPMLVVYPEGSDARFDVDPPAGRTSADVRLVDVLLERLGARFPLDARRIYASGFSNGAAFCYRLAAERPDVIAAIAPVAGYLPALGTGPSATPVPLLHVHGSADRRVPAPPLSGGAGGPVSAWARRNGATRGPEITTPTNMEDLVVRRAAYTGASPRADATLLVVEGEDHAWPGGPDGPISRAIVAFLLAHPRDATTAATKPLR